jgi:hypothetical protein
MNWMPCVSVMTLFEVLDVDAVVDLLGVLKRASLRPNPLPTMYPAERIDQSSDRYLRVKYSYTVHDGIQFNTNTAPEGLRSTDVRCSHGL